MRNLAEHRRAIAEKELGSTLVKRNIGIIGLIIFCLMLFCVPVCQFILEIQRGKFPYVLSTVELLSEPKREAIEKFEDVLKEKSVLTNWILPSVQTIMTGLLRTGNEQA